MIKVRITFEKEISRTSYAFLKNMKEEDRLIYFTTLQEEAQKHALDYVQQWINDGSVIPTAEVVEVDL